jgi:hypothetical protein
MATSSIGRSRGVLDVAQVTTTGYIGVPVVRNNLTTLQNNIEYNSVQLLGANVKLSTAAGKTLTLPSGQSSFFYAAAAGRLDPGMSSPMFVEILSKDAAKSLAGMIPAGGLFTVVAELRPVGMRSSDQIIGGPLSFPIDLCSGCLVPPSTTCPLPKGSMPTDACFPQQDDTTICCTNASGQTLCGTQAPVATM